MSKQIKTPLTDEVVKDLKCGDIAYITGDIYTARDAAHKRIVQLIDNGEELPFDFNGQVVYYAGPCPNKPEHVIGSIGPTTSGRMDAYSPKLIEKGLKAMIGKGLRDEGVISAMKNFTGVYFAAIGGAGALLSKCVRSAEVVAFDDLGTEAIRKLYVENFPVVVAIDSNGNNIYNKDSNK